MVSALIDRINIDTCARQTCGEGFSSSLLIWTEGIADTKQTFKALIGEPLQTLSAASHHGICPLRWHLTKTHRRPRYRDYLQRCCICLAGSWRGHPNPIRHKASIPSELSSSISDHEQETGTPTSRMPGLQKFPQYHITTTTATSAASRTGWTSRMKMSS